MANQNSFRLVSLLAVLLASSCAEPPEDKEPQSTVFEDPAANHPITAEPVYRSLKLANAATLSSNDETALAAFVDEYLARGNGEISVSVPAGANSSQEITALGEHIAGLGVPRSRILVGVQDAGGEGRIEIGYITYEARMERCGDWSENAADTFDNLPMPNYGCAVQHNIAAELADPRDIDGPRGMTPEDATKRMQVLNKYEQGQTTAAQKSQDQSGAVSSVGSGAQ
jgi:pilus assembly protein CpaD